MPYTRKTFEELRAAILTDFANQLPGADVSTGSDIYIKASALASAMWGLYQYQEWIARQVFPDSAEGDYLDRHASIHGMARKQAAKSTGTVTLTGANGIVVPAGLSLKTDGNVYFETTTGGTIAAGTLDVSATAKDGGTEGNVIINTVLTILDPVAGLDSTASAKTAFTGGIGREKDSELLSRLLDLLRQPPAGGNANDYKQWALEISGVVEAHVFPLRLGLGSVTVVPLISGTGAGRIPQQALLDSVRTHIDAVRPVTVKVFQVLAPTARVQDITASIKVSAGYSFNQVKVWVEEAVTSAVNALAPLETLYKSKLERVISDVEGVEDRSLTLPAGNVTPVNSGSVIEMVVPGVITITEMP